MEVNGRRFNEIWEKVIEEYMTKYYPTYRWKIGDRVTVNTLCAADPPLTELLITSESSLVKRVKRLATNDTSNFAINEEQFRHCLVFVGYKGIDDYCERNDISRRELITKESPFSPHHLPNEAHSKIFRKASFMKQTSKQVALIGLGLLLGWGFTKYFRQTEWTPNLPANSHQFKIGNGLVIRKTGDIANLTSLIGTWVCYDRRNHFKSGTPPKPCNAVACRIENGNGNIIVTRYWKDRISNGWAETIAGQIHLFLDVHGESDYTGSGETYGFRHYICEWNKNADEAKKSLNCICSFYNFSTNSIMADTEVFVRDTTLKNKSEIFLQNYSRALATNEVNADVLHILDSTSVIRLKK